MSAYVKSRQKHKHLMVNYFYLQEVFLWLDLFHPSVHGDIFFIRLIFYRFISMYVYFMCMSVIPACMQCTQRLEEGIISPRTGVIGGCELPCGCWELNLGPCKTSQRFFFVFCFFFCFFFFLFLFFAFYLVTTHQYNRGQT